MTIVHEMKNLEGCGCSGGGGCTGTSLADCGTGVLGIKCCTNKATSSVESIEIDASKPTVEMIGAKEILGARNSKRIDIEFENVRYTARKFSLEKKKFVTKEILHGIDGVFRAGELSAVLGPSGSGKSTLLNVLSGYRSSGFSGTVKVNGKVMQTQSEKYRKLSSYIQQDDLLRPQLTVGEVMMLAAHLKLGYGITRQQKSNQVENILKLLGMEHRLNVFTAKLSGGQKKRLAIALELISNPPVLYLDEPTSGLDSSSCTQCVSLLKKLASQGLNIICTIHQPSALVFEMFNKIYTVVDGRCMYQGPTKELLPFLAEHNLYCPTYHNPADFLLEVACGEHERNLDDLISAAQKKYREHVELYQLGRVTRSIIGIQVNNGKVKAEEGGKNDENDSENGEDGDHLLGQGEDPSPPRSYIIPQLLSDLDCDDYGKDKARHKVAPQSNLLKDTRTIQSMTSAVLTPDDDDDDGFSGGGGGLKANRQKKLPLRPASFLMQYYLLLQRNLLCARRSYFMLVARLISHLVIGMIFGYLYQHVGQRATTVLGNYVYLYGTTLLLVYTGKMAVVLTFPLEIDILRREHFNRWYSLGPHLLSILSIELPFQSLCAILYLAISAYLTDNDSPENFRVYYFLMFGVMVSLSAQAWGFFMGANLPIKLAVFLGPILAALFSVFGFCTRYIDITPLFRWLWHISYFRAGFHGSLNAIYGMDRQLLPCPEDTVYCHFRSPKVFLNFMMISDVDMGKCFLLMGGVMAIMYALTSYTIWHKLHKR